MRKDGTLVLPDTVECARFQVMRAAEYCRKRWSCTSAVEVPPRSVFPKQEYLREEHGKHDVAAFDLSADSVERLGLTPMSVVFADVAHFDQVIMVGTAPQRELLQCGGRLMISARPDQGMAGYGSSSMQSGGGVFPLVGKHLATDETAVNSYLMIGVHTGYHQEDARHTAGKTIGDTNANFFYPVSNGLPRGPRFLDSVASAMLSPPPGLMGVCIKEQVTAVDVLDGFKPDEHPAGSPVSLLWRDFQESGMDMTSWRERHGFCTLSHDLQRSSHGQGSQAQDNEQAWLPVFMGLLASVASAVTEINCATGGD